MENKFLVGMCRFHVKEKNCFLFTGQFQKNTSKKNQLEVFLDDKKIPIMVEEKDLPLGEAKSISGTSITKEYFIWVKLPEDWRQGKKLKLMNLEGDNSQKCVVFLVSKLIKHEKKLWKYVDSGSATNKGFEVTGWYIDDGHVKVTVSDKTGKEYPVQIKYRRRPDVKRVFPECQENEVRGFQIVYKGTAPKQVTIRFNSEQRYAKYSCPLTTSPVKEKIKGLHKRYEKVKTYKRKFGTRATVNRIVNEICHYTVHYGVWYKMHAPSGKELKEQRSKVFEYAPKISIVVPLYKTPENFLKKMIESVQNQTYTNWELCLSDGSGTDSPLTLILKEYAEKDKRIKIVYTGKALQISENTNEALKIATGDFIAFTDHDDLLAPNALYECVSALNEDKSIDIIYTDEDKIDMKGKTHFMPHFKPDFNIDMLRSVNYFCHLFVVCREIYEKVGLLNPEFDGAQDYDFVLRCVEQTNRIHHIAKILYHWRAHEDSTAGNAESKNYAFEAGARAIQAHYERMGINAIVSQTIQKGIYRSKYVLQETPKVSVIIPNKDHKKDLEKCLNALEKKNSYENIEYIIVENNSTEKETFSYYEELETKHSNVKVVYWKGEGFNYPSINNLGVEYASGDYLLFLNNDTEIINSDCIEELLGVCLRKDVGAVGAKLYYEDRTVQHAGVIVGLGGVAGHAFVGLGHNELGYFGRAVMQQDYSAVTAACMMVKKSVFNEVGGFDEKFAVAFNDVDFCLKIRKLGYLIVYNPYAELMHYESKSRGYEDTEEKIKRFNSEIVLFQSRWKDILNEGDPYYNQNLTLSKNDFSIK